MTLISWSNITDFSLVPAMANTNSGGIFWISMLWMIFIILILVNIAFGFEIAILVASFVSLVLSILLAYSGLVAWSNVVIFVSLIIFMFFYISFTTRRG